MIYLLAHVKVNLRNDLLKHRGVLRLIVFKPFLGNEKLVVLMKLHE